MSNEEGGDSPCIPMLKALADETRWRLVKELLDSSEELPLQTVADRAGATTYNTSKHVRILREAGIVKVRKDGRFRFCGVTPAFRERLEAGGTVLDLGCCTFRFDGDYPKK